MKTARAKIEAAYAWLCRFARQHSWGLVLVAALLALCASDWPFGFWDAFWVANPLVAGVLGNAILIALTLAIVDERIANRSRKRWEPVAATAADAFRNEMTTTRVELVEHAQKNKAVAALFAKPFDAPTTGARISREFGAALPELIVKSFDDAEWVEELDSLVTERAKSHQRLLATWAPVMVDHPELRPLANLFAAAQLVLEIMENRARIVWITRPGGPAEDREARRESAVPVLANAYGEMLGVTWAFMSEADDISRRLGGRGRSQADPPRHWALLDDFWDDDADESTGAEVGQAK